MARINRRDFLKLVGAGSVGAGAGFLFGEANENPIEYLIPYVVPPEDFVPGVATWYNSVCKQCLAGCGIMVRIREGRAKKIEGNPLHPVNQGKLCAMGQAGLQVLYNPDRIKAPLKRTGDKGSGRFEEITWDEAISILASNVEDLRSKGDASKVYLLSETIRGHLGHLFQQFMDQLGSENYIQYDFSYPESLYAANKLSFKEDFLPYYDIKNTNYLLSFGADYLNTWISPVHHSISYGQMRQGRPDVRGKFIQIEPRMSMTGANADEWIQVKPGTEGILALGLSYIIVNDGYYKGQDIGEWESVLVDYTPELVSRLTGVSTGKMVGIAKEFSKIKPSLAIGGGASGNYSNGTINLVAVNALNYLSGNIGEIGGILFNSKPSFSVSSQKRPTSFSRILQLIDDVSAGKVNVLIVHNTNPLFTMPASTKMDEALGKIPLVVSISNFMDETTAMADLILPSHTYLESWGDDFPEPGIGFPVATLSQPVVQPLYDTKASGDIILSIAKKIDGDFNNTFKWESFEDFLKDVWNNLYKERESFIEEKTFEDFWNSVLQAGVWGEKRNGSSVPVEKLRKSFISEVTFEGPKFSGSEGEFPFYLHPYLTQAFHDGRGANLPWLQEMPDTMTTVVWGSWVEINPVTAKNAGLREGDLVWVESPFGKIKAPIYIYPGIMPEVIGIPIGQGHSSYGRYAKGRGANPIQILAPSVDSKTGALAWAATRVKLVKTGERVKLVKTEGGSRTLGRPILGGEKKGEKKGHEEEA